MKTLRTHNGFTVLEVAIATLLVGAVVYMTTQVARSTSGSDRRFEDQAATQGSLFLAFNHMVKVGRLAGGVDGTCRKVSASILECLIDYSNPPTGNLSKVRFAQSGQELAYQVEQGGVFHNKVVYPGIAQLEICDDTDMSGSCVLEPRAISSVHTTFLVEPARLFRFRLTATNGAAKNAYTPKLQSAFYVRNPGPSDGNYVWGEN